MSGSRGFSSVASAAGGPAEDIGVKPGARVSEPDSGVNPSVRDATVDTGVKPGAPPIPGGALHGASVESNVVPRGDKSPSFSGVCCSWKCCSNLPSAAGPAGVSRASIAYNKLVAPPKCAPAC